MTERSKRTERSFVERRLYEFLGIKLFRKLALKIESFRHRKDNSRNINYHLHGGGISSVKSFTGYLLYNAVCHTISLSFVVAYFAITGIVGARYIVLDISMCILLLINLYCIMLQRYTYIKIREFAERLINTREKRIADRIECLSQRIEHRDYKELQKELLLIERMQESIYNATDCVIKESDAAVLSNISKYAKDILGTYSRKKKENDNGLSLDNAILSIPRQPVVINKVAWRTAKLQNVFRFEKRNNVLFGFSIITETDDCEKAYRSLIQDTSRDSVEFAFDVLFGAYNKALLSLRRT